MAAPVRTSLSEAWAAELPLEAKRAPQPPTATPQATPGPAAGFAPLPHTFFQAPGSQASPQPLQPPQPTPQMVPGFAPPFAPRAMFAPAAQPQQDKRELLEEINTLLANTESYLLRNVSDLNQDTQNRLVRALQEREANGKETQSSWRDYILVVTMIIAILTFFLLIGLALHFSRRFRTLTVPVTS